MKVYFCLRVIDVKIALKKTLKYLVEIIKSENVQGECQIVDGNESRILKRGYSLDRQRTWECILGKLNPLGKEKRRHVIEQ